MNIEIANRLYEFRKQSGLSQEELAEKLGISRQSVSKWERAESSPDTDNLIELAKIYNVTMDDLLNTNKDIIVNKEDKKETPVTKNYKILIDMDNNDYEDGQENEILLMQDFVQVVYNSDGKKEEIPYENIYTVVNGEEKRIVDIDGFGVNKYDESPTFNKIKDITGGVSILIIVAIYVALCALKIADWGKLWVLFVYYPVIPSILEAIKRKDANTFAFPVLCAAVYVTLGMYFDGWHPYWFIFLLIPIYHIIASAFNMKVSVYFYDEVHEKHLFRLKDGAIKVHILQQKNQD